MSGGNRTRRIIPLVAALAAVVVMGACQVTPPVTTTTTTTTTHGHGDPNAPYISPDDARLTAEQRQRAKDLIARTQVGMQRFPNELSLILAGYESIRDADSGYEHYINWGFVQDNRNLDADAIESVVLETKPYQAKRVVAAMYILPFGTPVTAVPEVAGPLTPWHNHKDLCWDPTGKYIMGVFRQPIGAPSGRCIPWGTLRDLPPMLHVWVTPNVCGPFAEVDDQNGIIDQWLRSTGQLPPKPANPGCTHVVHSDRPPGEEHGH
jgi:hypothetical protein